MKTVRSKFQIILISCAVHFAVLTLAAWVGLNIFAAPEPEEYMELELIQDTVLPETAFDSATAQIGAVEPVKRAAGAPDKKPENAVRSEAASAGEVYDELAAGGPESKAGMAQISGQAGGPGNKGTERIQPPRILQKVDPVYPKEMISRNIAGRVLLNVEILENGFPGGVSVRSSSGYAALDEAAVKAVRRWRFLPAREESTGRAVRYDTVLPVLFKLK